MSLLEAVILGFIQGISEFLPVSSSGHLLVIATVPLVVVTLLFEGFIESMFHMVRRLLLVWVCRGGGYWFCLRRLVSSAG